MITDRYYVEAAVCKFRKEAHTYPAFVARRVDRLLKNGVLVKTGVRSAVDGLLEFKISSSEVLC
jgi:hypothetical protein